MKFSLFTIKILCVFVFFTSMFCTAKSQYGYYGYPSAQANKQTTTQQTSAPLQTQSYYNNLNPSIANQQTQTQQNLYYNSGNTNSYFANGVNNLNSQLSVQAIKSKLQDVPKDLSTLDDFSKKFGKFYGSSSEKTYRQLIFKKNQDEINNFNQDTARTYNKGVNKFADLTADQFESLYLTNLPYNGNRPRTGVQFATTTVSSNNGYGVGSSWNNGYGPVFSNGVGPGNNQGNGRKIPPGLQNKLVGRLLQTTSSTTSSASSIDWKSFSGSVQDQGFCGCCYAFTALQGISARQKIRNTNNGNNSPFVFLSNQQIIDCSTWDTYGCNGGYIDAVFDYVLFNGIELQSVYPFTSSSTGRAGSCKKTANNTLFKLSNYFGVQPGSCTSLLQKLADGPVSTGIAGYNLQFYSSGILNSCSINIVNHAVLLVGYTPTYWTIKNGWGTAWGQSGYARLAPGNTCQICTDAWYPQLI